MASVEELVSEIERAANNLDLAAAAESCSELASKLRTRGADFTEPLALKTFKCLRRKRLFTPLERTVEAYLKYAGRSPMVRTLYAQALIDQDQLMAGLSVVQEVIHEAPPQSRAAEEARGLMGRVYKQVFVRSADNLPSHATDALRLAVRAYVQAYQDATYDRLWPLINLVALVARAEKEQIPVDSPESARVMGKRVLDDVESAWEAELEKATKEEREPQHQAWLAATGLEASLALQDPDESIRWAQRYLAIRDADAFELGSTARQLREIWQLDQNKHQLVSVILPLLEADLLSKQGGQLDAPVSRKRTIEGGQLQSVYGVERFRTLEWLLKAVNAADGVGRVETPNKEAVGTGFLLRGPDVTARYGDRQVFLTNRHVVDDPEPASGVHPGRAVVRFTTHPGSPQVEVEKILWRSSPELDVTLLALKREVTLGDAGSARDVSLTFGDIGNLAVEPPPASRIYVIGHPKGADISYSLYDNELVALEAPFLYYRSPTLDGSSGSPLFNHDWRVIGIHHRGQHPEKQANYGSLFEAVRAALD